MCPLLQIIVYWLVCGRRMLERISQGLLLLEQTDFSGLDEIVAHQKSSIESITCNCERWPRYKSRL